jgi:predicted DNA-binding transcriptional regulator YafY
VRHYKVDRISAVDVQTLRFPKPKEFDLAAHLAGSFGIYRGSAKDNVVVRVRFFAEAVRYVREKQWHASQKLLPQRDGSVIAEFQLTATEEIKAWVLSFGAKAEVLEPETLRGRDGSRADRVTCPLHHEGARRLRAIGHE